MSLPQLDPLARAELEMLAEHWRDVYPNGDTFRLETMKVITGHQVNGVLTGGEAGDLFLRVCRFANRECDSLDFDMP